jgi:hypothetical protein
MVRRAPSYRGFLVTGGLVGFVGSLVFCLWLLGRTEAFAKSGVWLTVTVAGVTAGTTLIAGFIAVLLDRRSVRRHTK